MWWQAVAFILFNFDPAIPRLFPPWTPLSISGNRYRFGKLLKFLEMILKLTHFLDFLARLCFHSVAWKVRKCVLNWNCTSITFWRVSSPFKGRKYISVFPRSWMDSGRHIHPSQEVIGPMISCLLVQVQLINHFSSFMSFVFPDGYCV